MTEVTDPAVAPLDYADGAEATVAELLRDTDDVSSGSAALADRITSWETAYHFSPQRAGLLAPLRIGPGLRVVDVGCGSGVLTRALGETGADVVGIEAMPDRADAARARCRDLPNVRIVCDRVESALPAVSGCDIALLCGVLEYSDKYGDGPAALLAAVRGSLAADGVVVLAIENQLGLRYLLGGTEDHHSTSWIGLAGYPGDQRAPHTWPRGVLAGLLADAGLPAQRWLLPYPDYKLPRILLDESVFARPDAPELVDKLVREPLRGAFGGNDAAVAGRTPHRLATEQGIGALVASSFLVVAGPSPADVARTSEPGLAWLNNDGRRPEWRRLRRLDDRLTLHTVRDGTGVPDHHTHPWLRQELVAAEPLTPGRPLDAHLLDALSAKDFDQLDTLIARWRAATEADARALRDDDRRHPYLPGSPDVDVLPADLLDAHPGNFIVSADGDLTRVDREWLAGDGVDAELVMLRGLLEFAREIVDNHAPHPWSPTASPADVLAGLAAAAGLAERLPERWAELVVAEAALQAAVAGGEPAVIAAAIEAGASLSADPPLWAVPGGLATLRADHATATRAVEDARRATGRAAALTERLSTVEGRLADHVAALADERATTELVRDELATALLALDEKDDRIGLAFAELTAAVRELESVRAEHAHVAGVLADTRAELAATRAHVAAVERTWTVRAANRTWWPFWSRTRAWWDLLRAHPSAQADDVLRRLVPTDRFARYRAAAVSGRDSRLYFDVPIPSTTGPELEVSGWVAHSDMPVVAVRLLVGGAGHAMELGGHRPDVTVALRRDGVPVDEYSGVTVTVPVTEPGPVHLRVHLADGTVLERALGFVDSADEG
ncbi:MAG TPA: methyltransferase domain-containing protein [Pseudonocardiaceae bacterium]|jgi:SAM-dependent methyltransferase